jgi:glycosyltransferase involved in cell wall biosynthesis
MQPERPLLTIAIPTYNRSGCLAQLLEFLAPQLAGETRVELLISDNASPDDTPEVVASFQARGTELTYSRNETNIGPDANFLRCYEKAQGEYVWLVGDDDVIVPGGLREVLERLQTRRYDLIHVNSLGFRDTFARQFDPGSRRGIKEFKSARDFALYVSTGFTFISGIIFRKSAIKTNMEDLFRNYIGTNLLQLSWTFTLLRESPKCVCLLDRLIASRVENSGGYGAFRVFGTNLNAVVRDFFGLQSPVGRAILNRTIQTWFPWAIVQNKRGRHNSHLPEDVGSILAGLYGHDLRFWFFVYPLLYLPLPLAEIWLFAIRVVNRTDRFLGYPIAR